MSDIFSNIRFPTNQFKDTLWFNTFCEIYLLTIENTKKYALKRHTTESHKIYFELSLFTHNFKHKDMSLSQFFGISIESLCYNFLLPLNI